MTTIDRIIKKLGFDPKTADPGPCWQWPGTVVFVRKRAWQSGGAMVPVLKLSNRSTVSPIRYLVEYVNDTPFPKHPRTGRPVHRIVRCEMHPHCVNPYHAKVIPLQTHGYPELIHYPHQTYQFPT